MDTAPAVLENHHVTALLRHPDPPHRRRDPTRREKPRPDAADHALRATPIHAIELATRGPRERVLTHRMYRLLRTPQTLRVFMEHHVFAVWDFMCLVQALRRALVPKPELWLPVATPLARRFLNEMYLAEESDRLDDGRVLSHFELYVEAMRAARADAEPVTRFVHRLRGGTPLERALEEAPLAARAFVQATMKSVRGDGVHELAAALLFGREQLIPAMFRRLTAELADKEPERYRGLHAYLERHIELDGNEHGPAARALLVELCGGDRQRWQQAQAAAEGALDARLALWEGIARRLETLAAA